MSGVKASFLSIIIVLAAAGCATKTSNTSAECDTPLPEYELALPDDSIPEEYQQFIGVWGNGKWDGKLCSTLVVESVTKEGLASVIYSWGIYKRWKYNTADFARLYGEIKKGKLLLQFRKGRRAEYRFDGEELIGKLYSKSRPPLQIRLLRKK